MLHVVGWVLVAPLVLLSATQWFGYDGDRYTAALQALFPWATLPAAPLAVAAALGGCWVLAGAAVVVACTLTALWWPMMRRAAHTTDATDATFSVLCANLLAYNPTPDDVAAAVAEAAAAPSYGADVLVLVEPTPVLCAALDASLPARAYPARHELLAHDPSGVALWTRLPVVRAQVTRFEDQAGVDAVVTVRHHAVRIIAAHPYPPTLGASAWQRQLREFGRLAAASEDPFVIVGDFNACRWHPSFRRLLRAGLRTAHDSLGRGCSTSWPANRGALPPPFVRLDHALCGPGVEPVDVRDIRLPGSDHTGFVATFAVTRTATPAPTS